MKKFVYLSLLACIVLASCKGNRTNKSDNAVTATIASVTTFDFETDGTVEDGSFIIDESTPLGSPIGIKDIGSIEEGETVSIPVSVINDTETPFIISNVIASCGCTDVKYEANPILVGEKRTITAVYDSRGKSGVQFVNLKLATDRGDYNIRLKVFVNKKS